MDFCKFHALHEWTVDYSEKTKKPEDKVVGPDRLHLPAARLFWTGNDGNINSKTYLQIHIKNGLNLIEQPNSANEMLLAELTGLATVVEYESAEFDVSPVCLRKCGSSLEYPIG